MFPNRAIHATLLVSIRTVVLMRRPELLAHKLVVFVENSEPVLVHKLALLVELREIV
jgi:hypothetical protein